VNREAQATIMFLLGGALVRAGSTNLFLRYVKPGSRPLLLGAGIVLIITAIITIWYEWRPQATDHDQHSHEHGHREPRTSWLMVLPLLALILVSPPALGSYSAGRIGTALQPAMVSPTVPAGDPVQLSVVDYAGHAVYDHGRSLTNRRIELSGFITPGPGATIYLTRMVLNCCAADAWPVKIALTGHVPPIVQPDSWLEVIGTYTSEQTKDPLNNRPIPYINVTQAKPVPAPANPYDS
jgi:uncharacterized repeat protein (TIGR03943 family)